MKHLLFLLFVFTPALSWSQIDTRTITGTITDAQTNEPLTGATVFIDPEAKEYKDYTPQGAVADIDGHFSFKLPAGVKHVIVSYLGYKSEKVNISGKDNFRIKLGTDIHQLNDVVVTGYQRIERRKLTSSIAKIDADEIQQIGVSGIDQLLEGQIAGLVSTPLSGSPGGANRIRIRGTASLSGTVDPLWVVDGMPLEQEDIPSNFSDKDNIDNLTNSSIAGLNPDDIQDITILKDAAATAIYGARAANGVIVITTKKGKAGSLKVNVNAATFISTKPDFDRLNLMNANEKVNFELALAANPELQYRTEKGDIGRILKKYGVLGNYDGNFASLPADAQKEINALRFSGDNWGDLLYRTAINQQYGLSISGGTDRINYYFSAGYYNEQGTTKGTGFDRFNLSMNTGIKITKDLTFSIGLFGNQSKRSSYISDTDAFTNPARYTRNVNPYLTVYDASGQYVYDPDIDGYSDRYVPFNFIEESKNTNYELKNSSFKSVFNLEYKIIRGLKIESQLGLQLDKTGTEKFAAKETYFTRKYREKTRYTDKEDNSLKYFLPEGGIIQNWNTDFFQYNWRTQAQYQKSFLQKHDFDVMIGIEMRGNQNTQIHTKGFGFDERTLTTQPIVFPATSTEKNNALYQQYKKGFVENRFLSYYGTFSYTYDNRYTAFGSVRFDGSNLFGVDPKYRYLPLWSASAAWNINREEFLQDVNWLSNLKLRASYGLQGNIDKNTSPYVMGEWNNTTILPDNNEQVITVTSPPNQKLRWEKTANYNVGLDFGILDGRINITAEGYYRDSRDLIGLRTLPQENGFIYTNMNWARVTNKGFEISLSTINIQNRHFRWSTDFNISRNISKVERINIKENSYTPSLEGYPVNAVFALKTAGLDEQGLPMFWKDGKKVSYTEFFDLKEGMWGTVESGLSADEYRKLFTYAGDNDPKFSGGFINRFNYRDFDLTISCSFNIKQTVRADAFYDPTKVDPGMNYTKEILNAWSPQNPGGKYPALLGSGSTGNAKYAYDWINGMDPGNSFRYLDFWVKDISYLRVSSIRLGYTLPQSILKKTFISSARVNVEARNPFVFGTNYKGYFDPELYGSLYAQPLARTFSVGVNLSF
ncbi:SusC/RagA family TonB-linked outer membrane protein [Coprobacter tertius]|uniref:SusC/RagA family TonB-linked outer membrane protein n=1 Tax=Coprobacter tertius TaxID=2944915 RepID=A0ABT1MGK0_9BACT|nr:SusC/RagA family TonB-linked outer membrane protein [Coprobacter tertius]MCP9611169.1 SusC/RagA family TonB-linked outer membrane protein [Coprobacter tertius]